MLTEREAAHLLSVMADLPRLAAQTIVNGAGGSTIGSMGPPGVDLTAVDAGREQPRLLAKLSQCVRVVWEEMGEGTRSRSPELAERVTWATEVAWLTATAGWWQGDDWCSEWISRDVPGIRESLRGIIEANSHYRTCSVCSAPVEAYMQGDFAVAECPSCQRVLGMADVGYDQRIAAARRLLRRIVS